MSVINIAGIKETTYGFPFINKYIVPIHNAIAAVDWLAQEKYLHNSVKSIFVKPYAITNNGIAIIKRFSISFD